MYQAGPTSWWFEGPCLHWPLVMWPFQPAEVVCFSSNWSLMRLIAGHFHFRVCWCLVSFWHNVNFCFCLRYIRHCRFYHVFFKTISNGTRFLLYQFPGSTFHQPHLKHTDLLRVRGRTKKRGATTLDCAFDAAKVNVHQMKGAGS